MSNKILVVGASGPVGNALVAALSSARMSVIAAVQSETEGNCLRLPDVEVVPISYDHPDPIFNLMNEVRKVFFALPLLPSHLESSKKILAVAIRAQVKQFVYLSSFLADGNDRGHLGVVYRDVERLIAASGIPFTILRPRSLMQNFVGPAKPINGRILLPYGKSRVSFVDARDIAAVAFQVLMTEGHHGKIYHLTGGEALGAKEIATQLSRTSGKNFSYHDTPSAKLVDLLRTQNLPEWHINLLMEEHSACREGLASSISPSVQDLIGRRPTDFASFTKDCVGSL